MANKHRGEVEVVLDGTKYILKLTLNDFAELQDMYKMSLMDIFERVEKLDVKIIMSIVKLAIQHEHKDITESDIGEMNCSLVNLAEAVGKCLTAAIHGAEPSVKKKRP